MNLTPDRTRIFQQHSMISSPHLPRKLSTDPVSDQSGRCDKNTTDGVALTIILTVLEPGKSKIHVPADRVVSGGPLLTLQTTNCLLTPSFTMETGSSGVSSSSFNGVSTLMTSSKPHHLPKAPHSDTIPWKRGV